MVTLFLLFFDRGDKMKEEGNSLPDNSDIQ
jgi:hypothetical protein